MNRLKIKAIVRERDGHRCTKCGVSSQGHRSLHVHRVNPGSHYTVDGCVTICARCHAREPKRSAGVVDLEHLNDLPRRAFHAPAELFNALETYIDATVPHPTEAAVIRAAIEAFLSEAGYWPPPDADA